MPRKKSSPTLPAEKNANDLKEIFMSRNKDPDKTPGGLPLDSGDPLITDDLQQEFIRFVDFHPARRFSRNLRKMLLDFMMYDGALEEIYIKDLLYDLDGLFDLLDVIGESQGDNFA